MACELAPNRVAGRGLDSFGVSPTITFFATALRDIANSMRCVMRLTVAVRSFLGPY